MIQAVNISASFDIGANIERTPKIFRIIRQKPEYCAWVNFLLVHSPHIVVAIIPCTNGLDKMHRLLLISDVVEVIEFFVFVFLQEIVPVCCIFIDDDMGLCHDPSHRQNSGF